MTIMCLENGRSAYEQLETLLSIDDRAIKMCVLLSLQDRLKLIGDHVDLQEGAFLDYWKVVSQLRVVPVRDVMDIRMEGRQIELSDLASWNSNCCTLAACDRKHVIAAMIRRGIELLSPDIDV